MSTGFIVGILALCLAQARAGGLEARSMEDPAISVKTIIGRYVQACGGAQLCTITSETRSGMLLRGQTGKVPFVHSYLSPGRWCYQQTFAFGDQVCYGFDGTEGWVRDTKKVGPMDEGQALDLTLLLDPQAPLRIETLYPSMELTGAEKVGDHDAHTILAGSASGLRTELAFDRETGFLLRVGGMVFEDYREVDGVYRPFRIRLGDTDEDAHIQMVMEVTETRHGAVPDESMFEAPGSPLPLVDAPLYRPRTQVDVTTAAMDACVGEYRHPTQEGVMYTVSRRGDHLMLHRTGWPTERELLPASETDYFFRFPGLDFRFIIGDSSRATHLDIDHGSVVADRAE